MERPEKRQKTIITRIPSELASEVEQAAAKELLSVASYVRRVLLYAVTTGRAAA